VDHGAIRGHLIKKPNPSFYRKGVQEEENKHNGLGSEQIYGSGSQRVPIPRVTVLAGCQQQASASAAASWEL
jgi:hypothetical protein